MTRDEKLKQKAKQQKIKSMSPKERAIQARAIAKRAREHWSEQEQPELDPQYEAILSGWK